MLRDRLFASLSARAGGRLGLRSRARRCSRHGGRVAVPARQRRHDRRTGLLVTGVGDVRRAVRGVSRPTVRCHLDVTTLTEDDERALGEWLADENIQGGALAEEGAARPALPRLAPRRTGDGHQLAISRPTGTAVVRWTTSATWARSCVPRAWRVTGSCRCSTPTPTTRSCDGSWCGLGRSWSCRPRCPPNSPPSAPPHCWPTSSSRCCR